MSLVTPHWVTVVNCAELLAEVYTCRDMMPYPAEQAMTSCKQFACLYVALETEALAINPQSKSWRVNPKLHLFQELVEYVAPSRGSPNSYCTYRDEDVGGWLAQVGSMRGGLQTAGPTALRLLQRFCGSIELQGGDEAHGAAFASAAP